MEMHLYKRAHGVNYGYEASTSNVHFSSTLDYVWFHAPTNMRNFCPTWKRYAESTGAEGAVVITIANAVWESSVTQGMWPQILALIGAIGGYLSLMICIFSLIWVRQYPYHEVTNMYEARTLLGYAETEQDDEQERGLAVNAEHPAARLPPSSQARETPIGMTQAQRQKMPVLPPGIYSRTE
ncbi:unnamed protein product [Symbiodinium sp. CCMP2456]|nr:unnamed protein product [Symbiodinium sp. CCMP2456]